MEKNELHKTCKNDTYCLDRVICNDTESWRCIVKKVRRYKSYADNAVHVTGEHSHVPYPAKIQVKQAVTAAPSRSTQSRHAPRVIMQETHAALSQEVFAEIPSYCFIQRMIQRRNLNSIQDGPADWSQKGLHVTHDLQ